MAQHLAQRGTTLAQEMQQFSFYGRVCAMKGLLQALPKSVLCAQLHILPSTRASDAQPPRQPGSAHNSTASAVESSAAMQPEAAVAAGSPSKQGATTVSGGPPQARDPVNVPKAASMSQASKQAKVQQASAPAELGDQLHDVTQQGEVPIGAAGLPWLLLSDGGLPACCAAVQQSTDAHHKFHAVSALAYCLDRIKHCLQVGVHHRAHITLLSTCIWWLYTVSSVLLELLTQQCSNQSNNSE